MDRMPIALTKAEAADLTPEIVSTVKMLDCRFYNECLDVALKGDWPQFGCRSCRAFQAMDIDQKVQDVLGLRAIDEAAINIEERGKVDRRRGVKPGADAKVRKTLAIVKDDLDLENSQIRKDQSEEMIPLAEVLRPF